MKKPKPALTKPSTAKPAPQARGTFGDAAAPHRPFASALGDLKKQVQADERARKEEAERQARLPPPPPPPPQELSDDELLAMAMSGVKPLAGPARVGKPAPASLPTTPNAKEPAPQLGQEPDEPDWWAAKVDVAFLWSLGGDRPWQKRVQLKGCDPAALGPDIGRAIARAREQHHGCLLLAFEAGLVPLGLRVGTWIREYIRKHERQNVIGYMTAKPADGGTQAIYLWVRPKV
ncbi:MAG: hypothetical protein HY902_10720 [Deltaproteobacteria bacterium]|nr:hypothetical protein [Deltaproteobacteria bacterium]